jgi:hypothetical protein
VVENWKWIRLIRFALLGFIGRRREGVMDTAGCIYSLEISFSFWARAGFTAFLFCPRGLTDTPSISIKKCIIPFAFFSSSCE